MERIIWAIDPYQNELGPLRKDGRLLVRWFGKTRKIVIEPVFVLTPAVWLLPPRYFNEALPQLKDKARAKLDQFYASIETSFISKPTLLTHPSDHVENIVQALLAYATSRRTTLIVVRTHAKRSVSRMILGSVAETLLLRSPIPLLVLNPSHEIPENSRASKILFPTELRRSTEKVLNKILQLARDMGATIDLVHGLRRPRTEIKKLLGLEKVPTAEEISSRQEVAKRLKALASSKQVSLRVHLLSTDLSMDEFILQQAHRFRSTLIAMEAKSGETRAVFAGSTARRVVRAAPCPVWAIHARPRR